MNWRGDLHEVKPGFIWVSGHSDYSIEKELYFKYNSKCKYWFTVNKNFKADALFALPLGVTNNTNESDLHPIYGNTDIMIEVMNKSREIQNLVYMNFNIDTFPEGRRECYNIFKDKNWVTLGAIENTVEGRRRFLNDIRNHKFVICPRGNGIDTHRLWETLYMGSFPIVLNCVALEEFTDLPILFIDSWNQINESMLEEKFIEMMTKTWNMEKLKFSYWEERIRNLSQLSN
jgi:hypothetical protein